MPTERLQKILAQAGVASRRAAEKMISDGRVRVNGETVRELGSKADLGKDEIEVEGWGKLRREPLVYIALHKPTKVVSTVSDPEGRNTVLQVIEQTRAVGKRRFEGELPRVYPVGRLDFDAEGLILLTNDGELTNLLTHPSRHVPKTYMVKVRGTPDEKALARLSKGVRLRNEDGTLSTPTAPAEVRLVKTGASNSWLELTIFEGRNHQVKRMCDAVGHMANRLIRIDFGGIALDPLPAGAWRFLTQDEIQRLKRWDERPKARRPRRPTRARERD
jgi:23S rRNA pseudouridine2605 synthase